MTMEKPKNPIIIISLFLWLTICQAQGTEPNPNLNRGKIHAILTGRLTDAVKDSAWPGAVILASVDGHIIYRQAVGFHTYSKLHPTQVNDIFDLASVTKVIATTSAVMKLYEKGYIKLDDPVATYLPAFRGKGKDMVTIRQLLTHTGGLPPFKQYFAMGGNAETRIDSVLRTELEFTPGDTCVYSDVGLISLGKMIEAIVGKPLDAYVKDEFFDPLGMHSTFYTPGKQYLDRIVPTEINTITGETVHGYVHDENSHSMGGVTGHAGLFSTVDDLFVFSTMMLQKGQFEGTRIFNPETIALFTSRANVVPDNSRCLGWDSPSGRASGGVYINDQAFGHTGFTGTSLWIDPENKIIVILLTNAVHPNRSWKYPKYFQWRQRIHSTVYAALGYKNQNPKLEWIKQWDD